MKVSVDVVCVIGRTTAIKGGKSLNFYLDISFIRERDSSATERNKKKEREKQTTNARGGSYLRLCAMLTDIGDDDDVDEKGNSLAGTARYTTPLCGCFADLQSTCDSCCCPWFAMARQYEAVAGRENSFNMLLCLLNWCCGCTYFVNCYVFF